MEKKKKKLRAWQKAAVAFATVLGVLLIIFSGLEIAFVVADGIECWSPDYARVDLTEILNKTELTDEDYSLLYDQTGLTKTGINRALARGESGKRKIKDIQNDFFEKHEVKNGKFAPLVCTDYIEKSVENIYLEKGDILITSSTHISGVRIGHAGLIVNGDYGQVLQANAYGNKSRIDSGSAGAGEFTRRTNFMVFRIKDEIANGQKIEEIVDYAANNLVGIPYEGLAGLVTDKNKIDKTQCAHIIWYAFKQFGIDLDCNGGLLVTPYDIANSECVELVQVFGFDKDRLWK